MSDEDKNFQNIENQEQTKNQLDEKIELEVEGADKPGFVAENLAMIFV